MLMTIVDLVQFDHQKIDHYSTEFVEYQLMMLQVEQNLDELDLDL